MPADLLPPAALHELEQCGAVQVFVMTNRFRAQDAQYANSITIPLPNLSGDTRVLAQAAIAGLRAIFREGYWYKKAGVMCLEIAPASRVQHSLFDPVEEQGKASSRLMGVLDGLNRRFGRDTVTIASSGIQQRWAMRSENKTTRYTTCWTELPKVFAK